MDSVVNRWCCGLVSFPRIRSKSWTSLAYVPITATMLRVSNWAVFLKSVLFQDFRKNNKLKWLPTGASAITDVGNIFVTSTKASRLTKYRILRTAHQSPGVLTIFLVLVSSTIFAHWVGEIFIFLYAFDVIYTKPLPWNTRYFSSEFIFLIPIIYWKVDIYVHFKSKQHASQT